ncbi:hypothetical protein BATDEDRAFT_90689 [Batrachochytrium dendrobatidis JAM81]|uniref:D-lactate dehydratase n=2 Tax=Batrachochytrium dendrobatidis TaxID=109871 RepID=F4P7U3_BATDJ|nr:uncharacterized protein BATDEDRAFT_90689 [Batrachochytrium dendrobatidis JAM81]EGF78532.1 hypothetical protein BATDEDRAFT_90689 [Batrachochytrium dendrobatidis JAM81]KAJ8323950.1 hypothetical protein O5D80_007173 [Batrachochytrium dendrobatidis]KAK5664754.1 hypothetical protein QVD99_008300 [Batrachochytrium dendrobatidis]OAJ43678.1 hypothetical protein BDEG_27012 [Batrachochytrium dendrobatidis JEL423]|eukprot:XP_006680875.1 hypothetical protein BATDEDRAFT_90689 [Batrachochytrium dendrobatidis JAM81]
MTCPTVVVLVANGTEEMEAVITIDILRRAQAKVLVCSLQEEKVIECSRHVRIVPDTWLAKIDAANIDAVIMPGGMGGAKAFSESKDVHQLLNLANTNGKLIGVICAAPIALKAAGILFGKRLTSHPSVKDQLESNYQYSDDRVVVDGNLITSRGPGTAIDFALALVEKLLGAQVRSKVEAPMCIC